MNVLSFQNPAHERENDEWDQLQDFRAGHPLCTRTIAGIEWQYYESGSGDETLLILPGLLGFAEMSFQLILDFEKHYRVLAPNYPEVDSMDNLVNGLADLLAAEGVETVHIIGGSFGGTAAQWFVRRFPEKVDCLILSHTGGPDPERAKENTRLLPVLRRAPLRALRWLVGLVSRRALADAPAQRAFWLSYTSEMVNGLSRTALLSRYQVAIDFDAHANFSPFDLADWPGRILILEGDNDPIAETGARQALRALHPQAAVYIFQGAGHAASIARLEEYISVVLNFLAGCIGISQVSIPDRVSMG